MSDLSVVEYQVVEECTVPACTEYQGLRPICRLSEPGRVSSGYGLVPLAVRGIWNLQGSNHSAFVDTRIESGSDIDGCAQGSV